METKKKRMAFYESYKLDIFKGKIEWNNGE